MLVAPACHGLSLQFESIYLFAKKHKKYKNAHLKMQEPSARVKGPSSQNIGLNQK